MREVLTELMDNYADGVAMATVVNTWRSAPRPAGAAMLVTADGNAVGSVSGGCVEGALFDIGTEVLSTGTPQFHHFGVSDDDAFAVGLTCGGLLDVFVEKIDGFSWPELTTVAERIEQRLPVAVATIVKVPDSPGGRAEPALLGRHLVITPESRFGSLGTERLDDTVGEDARGMLAGGRTATIEYGPLGERLGEGLSIFVASFAPAAHMIVFGAIDFSAALVRTAKLLGYRVTVCDARPVFATNKRFPEADEVVVDWPHRWLATQEVDERTVIAVLTHDPKFDVPALKVALETNAGYIGAMGSRRTHEDRLQRLLDSGVSPESIARIHSPIGLDIGARTPEETAISICAEIVQNRWGGSGRSLTDTLGPIHTNPISANSTSVNSTSANPISANP